MERIHFAYLRKREQLHVKADRDRRDIGTGCSVYSSYLAEDDGHQEEVEQQRLGQMPMVQGEEEDGEEDGDVLVSRTAVRGAKQL